MTTKVRNTSFSALKIEGGILPHEFLNSIVALKASNQTHADYGISKSLSIKEEMARYWLIASDLFGRYSEHRHRTDLQKSQFSSKNWLEPFLRDLLGFQDLAEAMNVEKNERSFILTHHAFNGTVPLLLLPDDFDLDKADSRLKVDGYRIAPQNMMQEYLNSTDLALWGIISNGPKLRLLRENVSLTRTSYIDIDFNLMFSEELYSDFAAMWLTVHASRFKPLDSVPSSCIMETWRTVAHETGERIRENLRENVTYALRELGNGFLEHKANNELRESFEAGAFSPDGFFQELLRLVYRLLFLFTIEERDLLHSPDATETQRAIYSEGYGLARLRERALRRRHYDLNSDLWLGLQVTFRAADLGAESLGLPSLGGLFRDDQCSHLDSAVISNKRLLEAIHSLSFFRSSQTVSRVNYKNMGTEELGSVYESLLELHPAIDVNSDPWFFNFFGYDDGKPVKGSEKKLTGSYYTPPNLVSELIKSTLDPVIEQAVADNPKDPRTAILSLRVLDPACGSGHFLLAAARRLAIEITRIDSLDDIVDERDRQHALREVVQYCIFGVDRNKFAVELCKTALWIETVDPGKPLTFLDSHILQGDSLVGILDPEIMSNGIPSEAYKPLVGDDKLICQSLKKHNKDSGQYKLFGHDVALEVAVENLDIEKLPEDTLEDIENKRNAWDLARFGVTRSREKLRANVFVGAYFAYKTKQTRDIVPYTDDLRRVENNGSTSIVVGRINF